MKILINTRLLLATVVLCLPSIPFVSTSAQNPASASVQSANLHQWGAVTLFHGLPSDRVRAIAEDGDGAMWFGTDNGLARYDGRRTQRVAIPGLDAQGRVLALKFDATGALWAGTDAGAARLASGGVFRVIEETRGKSVTAILPRADGGAWLATAQGQVFECDAGAGADGRVAARALNPEVLQSADAERPGALELTSLVAGEDGAIYAGTRSRGVLSFARGEAREIVGRPRAYFVEALERDARGVVWMGTRGEGGLYEARDFSRPVRTGEGLGTVTALRAGAEDDLWVGTERRGVFRFRDARLVSRFTFEGTAGGLRSDHIYAIHVDREGVVWFGTDRGVCRFDPRSPRNERLSSDAESNFVRALYRTKNGELLCGTNRGLFVRDARTGAWRAVAELERQSIYAIAEDAAGRLVVGTSGGLHVNVSLKARPPVEVKASEPTDEATVASRVQESAAKAGDASAAQTEGEPPEAGASPQPTASPASKEKKKAREQGKASGKDGGGFSVRAIRIFQGATYLATYGRGVERLDGERRTLVWPVATDADAQSREVTTLHVEDERRLWIGTTRAGLYVLENSQVKAAGGELDKLQGSAVRAIEGSEARGLWVATTAGLHALDKGRLAEMVSGVEVRAVVAGAQDNVMQAWCATAGGGLLRVSLAGGVGRLVSRLDAEQGLASPNAFALLRLTAGDDGEQKNEESLLVGTNRGLVSYTPGTRAPSLVPVRILSRRLHAADELRGGLELPYPQDNLTLDVAALSSRTFPEQFQYAFTLSDDAGRELKRKLSNDAQFLMETLKPGRYRVEARAFTKDLVASVPLAFEFTVGRAPFPWTTTMLAVLLVLALVALTWGAVQNRKIARTGAALRQAHHDLAGARLNLANEAERERRRIARDLHDQTLADLRSLLLLTDQLPAAGNNSGGNSSGGGDGQRESFDPSLFRAEIESVSDEIRRICEDLSPSVLENVGLAAALEWALSNAVAHLPEQQKFEYEFVCEEDLDERIEFQAGVRMQIYRIAQEAINNICRHAEAARVRFRVELTRGGELLLTLEDDGRGFNPHDKRVRKGRGLTGIRARASLIEAEVSWHARKPHGTIFKLRKREAAPEVARRV
ncbi:MAG TPA: two-component regulator propeller domain-containing protein [Pyrinomonadaceae bacterium]|nr:two-component regulator propeller domain-containing protein [Pyrinomonadaceae bacterium]